MGARIQEVDVGNWEEGLGRGQDDDDGLAFLVAKLHEVFDEVWTEFAVEEKKLPGRYWKQVVGASNSLL